MKNLSASFAQETTWLVVGRLIQGLATFTSGAIAVRALGPTDFGVLATAIVAATWIAAISTAGLEHPVSHQAAAHRRISFSVAVRIRWVAALLGAASALILAISAYIAALPHAAPLFFLALLPLAQVGDLYEWGLVANRRAKRAALIGAAVAVVYAGARVLVAILHPSPLALAALLLAEWATRSVGMYLVTRGAQTGKTELAGGLEPTASSLLTASAPLWLSGIAVATCTRLDQFFVARLLPSTDLGHYAAGSAVYEMLLAVPMILLRTALPYLTDASRKDKQLLHNSVVMLMRITFYGTAVMGAAISVGSGPLVAMIYGTAYSPTAEVLAWLALALPFATLGSISTAWLVVMGLTKYTLWRTLAALVAGFLLNMILIPRYGIVGAAYATLVTQVLAGWLLDAAFVRTRVLFRAKCTALAFGSVEKVV